MLSAKARAPQRLNTKLTLAFAKCFHAGIADPIRWRKRPRKAHSILTGSVTKTRTFFKRSERTYQHEVDMSTLAVLLSQFKGDSKTVNDILEMRVADQLDLVQRRSNEQILRLLGGLEQIGSAQNWTYSRSNNVSGAATTELVQEIGFCVESRTSTISHASAGEGLFMKGNAKAGQIVAIYPGRVYMPYQLAKIQNAYLKEDGSGGHSELSEEYIKIFGTPGLF